MAAYDNLRYIFFNVLDIKYHIVPTARVLSSPSGAAEEDKVEV